jgi:RNA polymerase sigma-70 factor, ECF subfamily
MEASADLDPEEIRRLAVDAAKGDKAAWSHLVERYHPRLRRMVALRMDQRLKARVDPSDVLQDAYIDAATQLQDYIKNPVLPFYLWLRMLTGGRLGKVHRFHLGTLMRDADLEVPLNGPACPGVSSHSLADMILARDNPPDQSLDHAERRQKLQVSLESLSESDREVLTLRHFEKLGLDDLAHVLGITRAAAGKRYMRAMARLKAILTELPDLFEE